MITESRKGTEGWGEEGSRTISLGSPLEGCRAGRRRRMARALLVKLFRVLHRHGHLQSCEVDTIIMPILHRRKLRLGKVK